MTFEDWYKANYPDLRPEYDDMYTQLEVSYKAGYNARWNDFLVAVEVLLEGDT